MKNTLLAIILFASFTSLAGQETAFSAGVQGNWFKSDGSREWVAGFHGNLLIWNGKTYWNPTTEVKGKKLEVQVPGSNQVLYIQTGSEGKIKLGTDPRSLEPLVSEPIAKQGFAVQEPATAADRFFLRDTARITGFIKGYVKKAQDNTKFTFIDLITGEEVEVPFKTDEKGFFEALVPMSYPQTVRGMIGGRFRTLFLEPGQDLFVYLNGKEMLFMGGSSQINRELQELSRIQLNDLNQTISKMMAMSWPEFRQWSLDHLKTQTDSIISYERQWPVSEKAKMIKKRELAFPSYAYVVSFNEARKGLEALYKAEPKDTAFQPGEGFFSFILDSEINDPWSMASGAAYYNLVGEFGSSVGRIKSYAQTHQKLVDDFGLKGNLLPDLLYSEHLAGMMSNDMRPLTPQEADSVRILIREPAIRERLMEFSREQEAKAEALRVENLSKSGYYLPRIPNVGGELILDSIVAQYPGKLVFVDFWATWCGPCKAGIQRIKPLKEEYAGKDIVFVYITDPSTPLATWTRSIPDIKGYHYRLDEKTVSVLYKKYEVKTIPRYMLFDKMGQLISGDLGNAAHNNSELKQLLEKYLQNP